MVSSGMYPVTLTLEFDQDHSLFAIQLFGHDGPDRYVYVAFCLFWVEFSIWRWV